MMVKVLETEGRVGGDEAVDGDHVSVCQALVSGTSGESSRMSPNSDIAASQIAGQWLRVLTCMGCCLICLFYTC